MFLISVWMSDQEVCGFFGLKIVNMKDYIKRTFSSIQFSVKYKQFIEI